MSDLNGNEKYYYLDENLPTNSENIGHINAGDIMLYGELNHLIQVIHILKLVI